MAVDMNKLLSELTQEARAHTALGTELSLLLRTFEGTLAAVGARVRAGAEETGEKQRLPLQIEYDRAVRSSQWALFWRLGKKNPEGLVFEGEWSILRDASIPIKIRAVELLPTLLKRINAKLRAETRRIEPAAQKMRVLLDGMKEDA